MYLCDTLSHLPFAQHFRICANFIICDAGSLPRGRGPLLSSLRGTHRDGESTSRPRRTHISYARAYITVAKCILHRHSILMLPHARCLCVLCYVCVSLFAQFAHNESTPRDHFFSTLTTHRFIYYYYFNIQTPMRIIMVYGAP